MEPTFTESQLEDAVNRALEESGLHPAFRSMVRRFVLDRSSEWRICCGSDCDPCVRDVIPVVDRAREILGAPTGSA